MKSLGIEHFYGVASILLAAVLWGTTGVSATFAPDVSAAAIGAAAMGVGGLLQASTATRSIARNWSVLRAQWHCLVLGGLAVAIYPLAFYGSMRAAGVTIGTVVSIGSAPLLSALIEVLMDRLRITVRWSVGAALGLAGMGLLCLSEPSAHALASESSSIVFGVFLGLLAGLTYAFYSWAARRLMQRGVPSRAAMGAMFGLGGALLMPVLLATGAPFLSTWTNAAVGVYMALVPMFLGYVLFGYGLARVRASTATTITLLEPVVAAGLAALVVGERLLAQGWWGIGLIFACLVCITMPARASRRKL